MPEADMVIHSGDATFRGKLNEVGAFVEWFDKLPYKYKIFVPGNHDWIFQKNPNLGQSMLRKDMIYLEDNMVEVEGLKIYGSPWQPEFMRWAFNLPRGHRLREKWNKIPNGIDILVTHTPPLRILDRNLDGEHVGCGDLYEVVTKRVKPRLHTFGHIHLSYGMAVQGRTLFVNAAICGEDYKPNHGVVVVEIDSQKRDQVPQIILAPKQEPLDPLGVPMFTNRPASPLW